MKRISKTTRKSDISPLKECIDELLDTYKLRGKLNQTHVLDSWGRLMGNSISKRTTDIFISNNKLFVKLSSAPLKQELSISKSKIIKLLNEDAGVNIIDDVIFL